jgi:hypothetical protein
MPGLDGTGPRGEGPMTGGARGYCAPSADQVPQGPRGARFLSGLGRLNPLRGAGRGSRGRNRGCCHRGGRNW